MGAGHAGRPSLENLDGSLRHYLAISRRARCYSRSMTHDHLDHDARLADRAALLTIVSLCALLLSVVAMKLTFERTDSVAARLPGGAAGGRGRPRGR